MHPSLASCEVFYQKKFTPYLVIVIITWIYHFNRARDLRFSLKCAFFLPPDHFFIQIFQYPFRKPSEKQNRLVHSLSLSMIAFASFNFKLKQKARHLQKLKNKFLLSAVNWKCSKFQFPFESNISFRRKLFDYPSIRHLNKKKYKEKIMNLP